MWSIGNEVDYPNDPFSHPVLGKSYRPENPPAENLVRHARPLLQAVRRLDPTRPVTAALASVAMSDAVGLTDLVDIAGYNYQEARYVEDRKRFPGRVIYGSENNHQFASWVAALAPDVAGQFLWTGIDYLGEARAFPNRANGAGLLDLCGFKKPMAWFRQSLWSDAPMVYLAASPAGAPRGRGTRVEEHWNWREGSTVSVVGYTNVQEVLLTLNGRPIGTTSVADAVDGVLTWEVPFSSGVLKAVGRVNGRQVASLRSQLRERRLASADCGRDRVAGGAPVGGPAGRPRAGRSPGGRVVDRQGVRVPTETTSSHSSSTGRRGCWASGMPT
jgi:beta-galactosidase